MTSSTVSFITAGIMLLSALPSPAQTRRNGIISDLSGSTNDDGIVSNLDNGKTINEGDYAASGILYDWSDILKEFEQDTETEKKFDKEFSQIGETKTSKTFNLNGRTIEIPAAYNEEGIDLFMLTDRGIGIYLAMDAPAYFQEPDADVIKWIRFYAYNKRKYTERMFRRYEQWKPFFDPQFIAAGIPTEMSEICLIESGCTATPVSSAGAVGMWQLMPGTARDCGLKVDYATDERTEPEKATRAAIKTLVSYYKLTGDWTLTAAAYNCGPARITRQGSKSWTTMKKILPLETQQYVPSLLAIHYVWKYRKELGL